MTVALGQISNEGLRPAGEKRDTVYYPRCKVLLGVYLDNFDGASAAKLQQIAVEPIQATVHLNGYREADSFDLTFDAHSFPISPEQFSTMAVQIYIYAQPSIDDVGFQPFDPTVEGLVDDAELELSEDGQSFRVSGKDYTTLMLSKLWGSRPGGAKAQRVPTGDLVEVVQTLVDECTHADEHGGITLDVVFLGEGDAPTIARGQKQSTTKKVKSGGKGTSHGGKSKASKRGTPATATKNYWDVIFELCLCNGFICFVRGQEVVITTPNALTNAARDRAVRMAYGRNLKTLSVARHLGREQTPQIVCSTYDPAKREIVEVKWPTDDKLQADLARSSKGTKAGKGSTKDQKGTTALQVTRDAQGKIVSKTINIRRVAAPPGVTDRAQLSAYCAAYYAHIARAEAHIKWTTDALTDLIGADLTSLRPGDPCQVTFDAFNVDTFSQLPPEQVFQRLVDLGYSAEISQLLSTNLDKLKQFKQPFYTKDVQLSYDAESGIAIGFEGLNFINPALEDIRP